MYLNYNDNELLYLLREGSKEAFLVLYNKYDILIKKISKKACPYGDKKYDLIQEGRMILFECIRTYDSYYEISFYSYFNICFNRKLKKEFSGDYYKGFISFNEALNKKANELCIDYVHIFRYFLNDDPLSKLIFEKCIIGNVSIRKLSLDTGIAYSTLYRKRIDVIRSMKKYID
ncbi:MAG: hypothetical protein IKP77_00335 [Acholeplasmatales bacterium]|nr:hypothetical protein [Acholeplasmatales bacterium]